MIRRFSILLLAVITTVVFEFSISAEAIDSPTTKSVMKGNATFALDLYRTLKDTEGNLFFSPYSISAALAMTYAGARGRTEKQMAEVLQFSLEQERLHPALSELQRRLNEGGKNGAYELSVANALWGQRGYTFLKDFLDLLNKSYDAGLNEVDFIRAAEAACKRINTWVEKQTKGKIKDIMKPEDLDESIRLVLTNAIYFKGQWASQFEEERTKDAPFTLLDGKKLKVPLMYRKDTLRYVEEKNFQVLELPYRGEEISMFILLPKKFDGLGELENSLTREKMEKWLPGKRDKKEVIVYLPRFQLSSQFMLNDVLKSMGMTDAFDESLADFSGMTGKRDLFTSAVIHKAFIDVNEEGTEAAAATAVVQAAGISPPPPVFRADHPFIFMIRDNQSGSILFLGRLVNPSI